MRFQAGPSGRCSELWRSGPCVSCTEVAASIRGMLRSAPTPAREEIGLYTLDRSPNQPVADDCKVRGARGARRHRGERARWPHARRLRRAVCRVCRRRCARGTPARVGSVSAGTRSQRRLLRERSGTSRAAARAAASLELGDGERGSSSIIAPSVAGLSPRDPWLCAPASRRVCLFGGWSTARTSRRRPSSRDRDAVRLLSTLNGAGARDLAVGRRTWDACQAEAGRISERANCAHSRRARRMRADVIELWPRLPLRSSMAAPLERHAAPHFQVPKPSRR